MALNFQKPVDGLPIFHNWVSTAQDIFNRGFENWREIMEAKVADGAEPGNPMNFMTVVPVKGLGRVSILLWGVMWTYLNKDSMDIDEKEDFQRSYVPK